MEHSHVPLTAEQQRQLDLIEEDRKDRELLLLLLLLSLFDEAYNDAILAFQTGGSPTAALRTRITTYGPNILRNAYEGAYRDAVKTANRIAADNVPTGSIPQPRNDVAADINTLADAAVRKIQPVVDKANESLGEKGAERPDISEVGSFKDALREAMEKGGFLEDPDDKAKKPFELWTIAVTQVNMGYQPGLFNTWKHAKNVFGYQFCAILDNRTTPYCIARDGIQLYKDDYWWWTNFPPLHFSCRSSILALLSPFTPTPNPNNFPPAMPGFGIAPPEFRALSRNYDFKRGNMQLLSRTAQSVINLGGPGSGRHPEGGGDDDAVIKSQGLERVFPKGHQYHDTVFYDKGEGKYYDRGKDMYIPDKELKTYAPALGA